MHGFSAPKKFLGGQTFHYHQLLPASSEVSIEFLLKRCIGRFHNLVWSSCNTPIRNCATIQPTDLKNVFILALALVPRSLLLFDIADIQNIIVVLGGVPGTVDIIMITGQRKSASDIKPSCKIETWAELTTFSPDQRFQHA